MSYINIALSQAKTRRVLYAPGFTDTKISPNTVIAWHCCPKFTDEPVTSLTLPEPGEYRINLFTSHRSENTCFACSGPNSALMKHQQKQRGNWRKITWTVTALTDSRDDFDFYIHLTSTAPTGLVSCEALVLIYELIT